MVSQRSYFAIVFCSHKNVNKYVCVMVCGVLCVSVECNNVYTCLCVVFMGGWRGNWISLAVCVACRHVCICV
jgi:hypothetical protein